MWWIFENSTGKNNYKGHFDSLFAEWRARGLNLESVETYPWLKRLNDGPCADNDAAYLSAVRYAREYYGLDGGPIKDTYRYQPITDFTNTVHETVSPLLAISSWLGWFFIGHG